MRYWIVLFLFCLGIGPAVQAQNKGVVKGRVFDLASNEAIPFANVVVYGTTLGGATDEEGRFRLENVPPGLVRLEVSSIGYQTLVTVGFCWVLPERERKISVWNLHRLLWNRS